MFEAAGTRWAIPARGALEILPMVPLDRPAGSPKALAGFANVGGAPLAVVRLAALFGDKANVRDDFYHHIVRLAGSGASTPLGLLVDRVHDVAARAERLAPLDPEQSVNGAVVGNLVIADRLVPLLDCGRLLLIEEEQRIADLADATRARMVAPSDAVRS